MRLALEWAGRLLLEAPPRTVKTDFFQHTSLFTDGACEGDAVEGVTVGAVLFKPGWPVQYFGCHAPPALVRQWRGGTHHQVIGQAEILPVLLAKQTWPEAFEDSGCICYVDNNSA
eukprot:8150474-Lingulodinium_polyedra.AAC.1